MAVTRDAASQIPPPFPSSEEQPPPEPRPPTCCRYSARYQAFDLLLFRRATVEGEIAVIGPLALQIDAGWIWGSPADNLDDKGYSISGDVVVYLEGTPLRGFFLKAHVGY